ncbi:tetracycline resistance protein [Streptomyces daqingensis]|uniref:Tetracycline resistance protein n=1 Tax=Streptomyces daqingensis TaxID=1472640 RepID=A0ABQ2MGJ6_9ACTN|nr:tetracycline resistance protein [Streptomyces daqingensis]
MTDIDKDADAPDSAVGTPGLAPGAPPRGGELAALRRRTTAVLVSGQMLGGLGVTTAVTLTAVLAEDISGSEALAGLASTAAVVGSALLALPLASLMIARGRRVGLSVAYLIGAVGGTVVVVGAAMGSFALLLAGMTVFGASNCANLQARYAAADLAEPGQRARAISFVVWATTIGAVLGPNIASPAGRSVAGLGIPASAGGFVWATAVFLITAALVHLLLRPDPLLTARAIEDADRATRGQGTDGTGAASVDSGTGGTGITEKDIPGGPGRESSGGGGRTSASEQSLRAGLRAVAASARARLALTAIAVSHTAMVTVMVMTPVDLGHHGAGIQLIGLVISAHIVGMYAFSPVMGWLADRFGRLGVILLAVALIGCASALAGTADGDHVQSMAGLFLLGLGWSAGLVSGSALLTDSVPQPARPSVQGLSDLIMNASAGVGGALSGLVVSLAGYGWLTALAASLLLPVAALTVLDLARHR